MDLRFLVIIVTLAFAIIAYNTMDFEKRIAKLERELADIKGKLPSLSR